MPSRKRPPEKAVNRGAQVVWAERGGNGGRDRPDAAAPRPFGGPPETASLRAGVAESSVGRSWPDSDKSVEPEVFPEFLRGEFGAP